MDKEWLQQMPLSLIDDIRSVSGGDVNDAYEIRSQGKKYFLLVQPDAAGVTVPKVYDIGEINEESYFMISFLEEGPSGNYGDLAEMITRMHRTYSADDKFGYDYPYRGSQICFDNDWTDSWSKLFIEKRMDVLREQLIDKGRWDKSDEEAYGELREIMVEELSQHESKPSLLHGDLWGGNYMFLTDGSPALFDLHPLYGNHEFDIGVTTSFGVYPAEFYQAYQKNILWRRVMKIA